MTQKDIQKEAFDQANKELLEEKVKEVKDYILRTLNKIEQKKKEKETIDEELRILKLDLEDLRNGNFDKIKERQEKSQLARQVSVPISGSYYSISYSSSNPWIYYTSGTYNLSDGKNIYL